MPRPLTWLHLSDLHFSPVRHGADQAQVLRSLTADIAKLARDTRLSPDFIVVTGDVAFGELRPPLSESIDDQFDGAFRLLETIRTSFAAPVPRHRIFIVPGNHDVKRSEIGDDQTHWLRSTEATRNKVEQMVKSGAVTWNRFALRLKAFADALTRHGYAHLVSDPKRPMWVTSFTLHGVSVGVAGLNSAWSSSEDGEKGRLWMAAKWQLQEASNVIYTSDVRFVACHHPFNWLVESEEEQDLWRTVESEFHFMLHGHEHDEWISFRENHAKISAAAMYDGIKNGYNLCSFEPRSRLLKAWFRTYDAKGRDWIPHVIAHKTDNNGHLTHLMKKELPSQKMLKGTSSSKQRAASAGAFLAVPMAAVGTAEYVKYRGTALKALKVLRSECGLEVYYAGENIKTPDMFEPTDLSWRRNLHGLEKSKLFILLYPDAVASSVLVEAGMALAQRMPSLYLVRKGVKLPFMLEAASQVYANVAVRRYVNDKDLGKILTEDGMETCKALIRGDKSRQR